MNIILKFPSTLHSTCSTTWLGLAIGVTTDLRSVRMTHHAKEVHKWNCKNLNFFSRHYLRNRSTSDSGIFSYIDVIQPKERSPEIRYIPPETPCINSRKVCSITGHVIVGAGLFAVERKTSLTQRPTTPSALQYVWREFKASSQNHRATQNLITTLSPTQCAILIPDILYYNVSLNTATCFDPSWDHHQGFTLK
jgi:hypothetical protein